MNQFYEKYGLIAHGISRNYKVAITDRVFGFERATVRKIKIEDLVLIDSSWKKATCDIAKYLQNKYKLPESKLFSFSVDWSIARIFQDHKFQVNCEQIARNIWFNVGFSSTHGIWLVQSLIKFFGVNPDDCEIVVHLPSMSEPEEVLKYYKNNIINNFKSYLLDENLSEEACGRVIRSIELLNKVLVKLNCGSNDFFLINDRGTFSTLKSKVLTYCGDYGILKGRQLDLAKKFLEYYSQFFKEYELKLLIEEN